MDGTRHLNTRFHQQTMSPLVGMQIITSTGEVFNHVDHNEPMWSGTGDRNVCLPVLFAAPFFKPPHVTIGLSGIDASKAQNLRFNLVAEEITRDGFIIKFVTWGDTKIARASATWSAIGTAVPIATLRRGG